jgi:hypothetical protein
MSNAKVAIKSHKRLIQLLESPVFSRSLLYFLVLALPLFSALKVLPDPDFWWHLATGRWIHEHHSVPSLEPFSWVAAGRSWVAYSWLFELGLYQLYCYLGSATPTVYVGVFVFLVVYQLEAWITESSSKVSQVPVLLVLGVFSFVEIMTPRPWLISILFFIIEMRILFNAQKLKKPVFLWFLPLLFAFWANIHIQFIYGLLALFLNWIFLVFNKNSRKIYKLKLLTWILAASFLATFLNPYHYKIYRVILEYATQFEANRVIDELKPADFSHFSVWCLTSLVFWAVYRWGFEKKKLKFLFTAVLFFIGVCFSFRMVRDVWFGALTSIAFLLDHGKSEWIPMENAQRLFFRRSLGVLMLFIFIGGVLGLRWGNEHFEKKVAEDYPVHAVQFLAENHFPAPLFNPFNWGGYLIWALPQYRVSIDGRTNLYTDQKFRLEVETWEAWKNWENDPDLQRANLILTKKRGNTGLFSVLDLSSRHFKKVYEDEISAVFVREPGASSPFDDLNPHF